MSVFPTEMLLALEFSRDEASTNSHTAPATLLKVCQYLANDTSCYEDSTGDANEWHRWTCLFTFDRAEVAGLFFFGAIDEDDDANLEPDGSLHVSYTFSETAGNDFYIGRAYFDEQQSEYAAHMQKQICEACGEEKYADDSFCNGDYCGASRYAHPSHGHTNGPCEHCVAIATADAQLG